MGVVSQALALQHRLMFVEFCSILATTATMVGVYRATSFEGLVGICAFACNMTMFAQKFLAIHLYIYIYIYIYITATLCVYTGIYIYIL